MTRCLKIVAMALMLVLGALPFFASASPTCGVKAGSVSTAPAMHACCPGMAMTVEAAVSANALQANHTMPCCRIAPAKPVRTVELQMPAASAELVLQPANDMVSALPATAHARFDYHIPLPDSARSQSHLCTFLI